jgi:predicted DCC family thiol-disulfide oxidoreductase YuxK
MGAGTTQPPSRTGSTHLVLFDGECALCNGIVQFVLTRDRAAVFRFASLQSRTGLAMVKSIGGGPALPTSFHVVADYGSDHPRVFTKGDAVLFVARQLGWPWRAAVALRIMPKGLRDRLYDAMARSRYRFFGRSAPCAVPSPEFQSRFID